MSVDGFTESLRILAVGLSALFILCVAECIRYWRAQRKATSKRPQPCHCKVVDAPHDWREHDDWISA